MRSNTRSNVRWMVRCLVLGLACLLPVTAAAQTATTKKPAASSAARRASLAEAQRTARARRLAAARARQAAAARALKEASTPRFQDDGLGNLVPDIRAAAAIIYNPQTGDVLWENNSHEQRSIASLTKIMTAVTFVSDEPNLNQTITVAREDVRAASVTYLRAGDRVTLENILHLTLIASDNAAARVLARVSEGGSPAFIRRMNEMAAHLGLTNTHYADPSGLDARNVSSAYDLSHLIAFATTHPTLGPIMRATEFDVRTSTRTFKIRNTNKLLGTDVDVVGGKTGFIRKAGYCLATLLQVPQGSQVAVVVLGAASSTVRFWETRHLFNWAVSRTQGLLGAVPALDAASRP